MNDRATTRARLMVLGVLLAGLLYSSSASAFWTWFTGAPYAFLWYVTCADGSVHGPYPSYGQATIVFGPTACEGHGGVSDVTDGGVENALAQVQTCSNPSTLTLGRDGGAGLQPLTGAEFQAIVDQTGGVPQELVGIEMMSVVVRGTELLPNPPQAPFSVPLLRIYSDENEDGSFVGGVTGCTVPTSRRASILIALSLVATGMLALARTGKTSGVFATAAKDRSES